MDDRTVSRSDPTSGSLRRSVGAIHELPLPVDRFRGREKPGSAKVVKAKAFTEKRR
ncbi:MAG: hypothetical protein KatS3mg112_0391 [Thermogutta sp.]|nr:MAG: hypothetical protein KatS3mg112_0391 [Thermogutta sp.]